MRFHILESGSKGNCTLVESGGRYILIDMGVSLRCLNDALKKLGIRSNAPEAILLTHEHGDHMRGIFSLPRLPVYCTEGTYESPRVINVTPYVPFELIGLTITPVSASHDAVDPVGYVLAEKSGEKLAYLTDTGMIPEKTLAAMRNADYYVIEANHNQRMLHRTHRPIEVKLRILSDLGHLCNEDSAIYVSEMLGDRTKEIILAHLSEEANTPEEALKAYRKILLRRGIDLSKIRLACASQNAMTSGGEPLTGKETGQ